MCTAFFVPDGGGFACRNLDLEYHYAECVAILPRRYPLHFCRHGQTTAHYAMIGTAYTPQDMPLYYDAVNEHGLSMAGLNFPSEAVYHDHPQGIAPFEMIPWVLSQCRSVKEAVALLQSTVVSPINYDETLRATPLHWLLADRDGAVAIEPMENGLAISEDPVGVLTNAPPFDYHLTRLAEHTSLTASPPSPTFAGVPVSLYSRGLGGVGLPGDYSSSSRFVKASFVKACSPFGEQREQNVSQCFHILDSVAHPKGCVVLPDGRQQFTVYSSCCHLTSGVYYYKTYDSGCVYAVDLRRIDLNGSALRCYPHITVPSVRRQN